MEEGWNPMYNLDEFTELLALPGIRAEDIVQCAYGAETSRPTTLVLGHIAKSNFENQCQHQCRRWRKPSTGERHWGAHPPLKGKEWFILEEKWMPSMRRTSKQVKRDQMHWPFLTSAAQAYPEMLNEELCDVLLNNMKPKLQPAENDMVVMGRWKNVLKRKSMMTEDTTVRSRLDFTAPLRGKRRRVPGKEADDKSYLGGMIPELR